MVNTSTHFTLEQPTQAYEVGTLLRDVTIREARNMECNRCGGCCNGLLPDDVVKKDEDTGLPLFVWGDKYPEDMYEKRYGKPMLIPIIPESEIHELPYQGKIIASPGSKFVEDSAGKPYTCFTCTFHSMNSGGEAVCALREQFGQGDPAHIEQIRPLNCGEFPVFGTIVDDAIIAGHPFIVPTGALPKCTWYGLRIVGPWRDTPYWRDRWERQQRGESVPDMGIPEDFIKGLEYKASLKKQ